MQLAARQLVVHLVVPPPPVLVRLLLVKVQVQAAQSLMLVPVLALSPRAAAAGLLRPAFVAASSSQPLQLRPWHSPLLPPPLAHRVPVPLQVALDAPKRIAIALHVQ